MNEQEIFLRALEIAEPARRAAYLEQSCAADAALRRQVEMLLAAHARLGDFLDQPVLQQMAASDSASSDQGAETRGGTAEHRAVPSALNLSFLQPSDSPGSLGRLGHYDVQEVIGRGGFGIVLKAFDERLHRVVAIKAMAPELTATSPARKRFLREARAAAAIRHDNVISIYAVEDHPLPFLVMEYVDGDTLQQRIDQIGPLDVKDVLQIGQQIARGLAAAHARGLLHRDIKPANILLERGQDRVKLTDFGLARSVDDASLTQSGLIAGTPLYMSPEQARGDTIDQRSDLFSLGSVLYVMCSGRPPFRAATTLGVLKRVAEEQPRPIQEVISEVPDGLVAIIHRLHAKDPAARYSSAEEVADLLARGAAEAPPAERQDSTGSQPAPHVDQVDSQRAEPDGQEPVLTARQAQEGTAIVRRCRRRTAVAAASVCGLLLLGLALTEATGVTNLRGAVTRRLSSDRRAVVNVHRESSPEQPPAPSTSHTWPQGSPPPAIAPFDAGQARRHQQAWAKYLNVPVDYVNSLGMKFRLIPPGEFWMGSSLDEVEAALPFAGGDPSWEECIRSEAPRHRVILTQAVYLGVHEVTQAEYQEVMGNNPSAFSSVGMAQDRVAGWDTSRHPVETVSWNEAAEFCARLSNRENLPPVYALAEDTVTIIPRLGYRLPTEAEWEFACRAGTTTEHWTGAKEDRLPEAAWFGNPEGRTHPVGQLAANPFGLYDVHGSVSEWVQDAWEAGYYRRFLTSAAIDPRGPDTGELRISRSGDWFYTASDCRSASRFAADPVSRPTYQVGFRLALPVEAVRSMR